ncbi:heliorhodopsin HeR [Patescibacteria group bacterium]|nr:heliorhodopsin HeR [Patescibacteria group bacterium]
MEKRFRGLRKFNLIMAFFHFAQGIAMFVLSSDFSLPITTVFVEFNAQTQKLEPVLKEAFSVSVGPLVAGFLLISALAHLLIAMPKINEWYNKNLKRGTNYTRWIEYSFSSSLMIIVIAMLTGMYDGVSLMLMFFLNMMMILFGWVMELHNQTTEKTNWTSYWFGVLAGAIPWVAIALYLGFAGSETQGPPSFVYWIFFSIFLFFNVFAINMILQYKKVGKWKNYLYGEKAYIILSLVAKSLLAWQVWAGTLRPV